MAVIGAVGVVLASIVAVFGVRTGKRLDAVEGRIGGLGSELGGRIDTLTVRFEGSVTRFEGIVDRLGEPVDGVYGERSAAEEELVRIVNSLTERVDDLHARRAEGRRAFRGRRRGPCRECRQTSTASGRGRPYRRPQPYGGGASASARRGNLRAERSAAAKTAAKAAKAGAAGGAAKVAKAPKKSGSGRYTQRSPSSGRSPKAD